jgi:hypothetical protein
MDNRRTTPRLFAVALEGAKSAGHEVVAADIRGGGFVRLYFADPETVGKLTKVDATCNENEEIFATRSD